MLSQYLATHYRRDKAVTKGLGVYVTKRSRDAQSSLVSMLYWGSMRATLRS